MRARHQDLVGKIFGKLTVISYAGVTSNGDTMWLCRCECGTERIVRRDKLNKAHIHKACKCANNKKTAEQMREYKLSWYHANKTLVENPRTNGNDGKTHCVHGHEFTPENTVWKGEHRTCRECRNENSKQRGRRYMKDPNLIEMIRASRRRGQLKKVGWTPERFDLYWDAQGGRCEICNREVSREVSSSHTDKAYADHEHIEPTKPRGILCLNCNLGIGNLQENVEIMKAAITYVEKWGNLGK